MPSIDVATESLVTLTEATRIIPGRPSTCTIWRWYTRGVHGHRLETVMVGGRRFTSREAIARFIARGTAARDGGDAPALRSPAQRERAIRAAEKLLDEAGV